MYADPNAPRGAMIAVNVGDVAEFWEGWTSDGAWYISVQDELIPDLLEAGVITEADQHNPDAYLAAAWMASGPHELPGVQILSPEALAAEDAGGETSS